MSKLFFVNSSARCKFCSVEGYYVEDTETRGNYGYLPRERIIVWNQTELSLALCLT